MARTWAPRGCELLQKRVGESICAVCLEGRLQGRVVLNENVTSGRRDPASQRIAEEGKVFAAGSWTGQDY
jgi:hypothetical protein